MQNIRDVILYVVWNPSAFSNFQLQKSLFARVQLAVECEDHVEVGSDPSSETRVLLNELTLHEKRSDAVEFAQNWK